MFGIGARLTILAPLPQEVPCPEVIVRPDTVDALDKDELVLDCEDEDVEYPVETVPGTDALEVKGFFFG